MSRVGLSVYRNGPDRSLTEKGSCEGGRGCCRLLQVGPRKNLKDPQEQKKILLEN